MQTIYLDISNRGVIPVIYAKQGDVGRKVEVVLTNSGLPYEPEAGSSFSAWFSGASGVGNYTDIGEKSAFSVSGNKVTVELITQMLQNAGEGVLCLVLSRANGDQIGLWNIRYICECVPGAGSEPAKDYYTAFSQAVAGLAYPDASLSVAGKAADAAATGKALEGKAPAGYGLGVSPKRLTSADNLNTIWKSGWYDWDANAPANAPIIKWDANFGKMRVDGMNANNFTQTVESKYNSSESRGVVVRRTFSGGNTEGWEWDNPPMIPGVEYRTTERFEGKPVYTALINCGTLPSTETTNTIAIPSPIYGTIDKVIRCGGTTSEGNLIPFTWNGEYMIIASASRSSIFIYSRVENGSNTATIQLWYTKL